MAWYRHILEVIVISITFTTAVHAAETLNGNTVNNGVIGQQSTTSGGNDQHVQIIMEKRPKCERCLQNGKQTEEEASTSNQQRANAGNGRRNHGSIVLPKKRQHLEESAVYTKQPRKLNKANLQTSSTKNSASVSTLSSLTTEEKLNRIYAAQRTRQEHNHIGKISSQSKADIDLTASDNKEHGNKKERRIKVVNKNKKDRFSKLAAAEAVLKQHMDADFVLSEQLVEVKHPENNHLPNKNSKQVKLTRTETSNQNGPGNIRNSLQLPDSKLVKINNQSSLAKAQDKPREVDPQALPRNNSEIVRLSSKTRPVNVQELRSSKTSKSIKDNGSVRRKDVSVNDKYLADEAKGSHVSGVELADGYEMAARRRSGRTGNRLVRPSAADRLEQRISPDLGNSYLRLMDHMRRILQMFSQSMDKLKSYRAEIFNGTRYTIMMGARYVIEELNEAGDYIYDGVTSATQFTREVILKYHNSQHALKTGQLQKVPIDLTESKFDKRNFKPNLDRAYREQNKVQEYIGKVNAMKMKCLQGDSRLKQVRELFQTNYDRATFQDLYGYLNTSIHQINRGLRMSPQLMQLRRRKFYMDRVKDVLTTANSLLKNSADAFQKAMKQTKENYDTFKNWLQKEQSKHGLMRRSNQGLSSYHFGKLQQLVSQATEHVRELHSQYNRLHSILDSPLDTAKAVIIQTGKTDAQFELKLLTANLSLLLKDMLSSLDELRIHIGSNITLTWTKRCRSDIEGSGLIDTDDEDLCEEEEGSGFTNSDSKKVFATENEDFSFIDEPVEKTRPAKHSLQRLGVDLADFTSKLLHRSQQIYDNAQTLQGPLTGLKQHFSNIDLSVSSIERSIDTQKNIIIDFHDNTRHVQEVKRQIPEISQKIAALRNLNLEDAVNKAKQAIEKSKNPSQADRSQSLETTISTRKKTDKDRPPETDKIDDDFDYSGLFKQGQEVASNYADINLLRSMAVESCGKIGNRFTYIRSNMSLLRQKVEKAREILTTLQLSVSKSGNGYISVSIPQAYPEVAASLSSSIKACVKPKSLDGPLLFVRGNNSASYGVSLVSQKIAVTAYDKNNNDLKTVTLDKLSITEEWYTLEIQRTGETLSVMAVSQTGNTQTKRAEIGGLDLIQPPPFAAYVGGMPESLGVSGGSWEGCFGNLMVNGRALTLFHSDSKGIQPSLCTDHCISDKQKLSMVFSGNGFARFIPSDVERITSIRLKFKTHQKMASLLSLINKRQNFYLSVVMANGAVKIESSSPGERIVLLSLTSSLNDGHSHLLRIMYRDSKTYPELDGNREAFSVERTAPNIFTDVLDGVLIGAHIFHSKQFLTTLYRPLIGCIGDVFINDNRLVLPDALDSYNVFHGNCSSLDIWHSCLQWTDQSKLLSFGDVDNSNRISLLVSRDSLGSLMHFTKKDLFDIEVTLTVSGIDVSSDDSEGVIIRPAVDKSYFSLITITDSGSDVSVRAWDQSVSISYGGFWGFATKDLTTPHTVVIGESKDGPDKTFTGSIFQLTIEDRFYDLSQYSFSHNLMSCERPQEDIQMPPPPLPDTDEPFSCIEMQ